MRIWHSGCHIKSRIRNSVHARFAIVVGNVLQQPVDGVVGVGTFIHILGVFFVILVWRHLDKGSITLKAASHILIDENKSISDEARRRTEMLAVVVCSVRSNAVRRPLDQKGISLRWGSIFWHIDRCE